VCIQTDRDQYSRAVCVWFVRVIYDLRLADFVFFSVPFSVPFSSFFCSVFFPFLFFFLPFSSFFFPNDMEGTWHGRHVWESVPRLQADSKPISSRLQAVWESVPFIKFCTSLSRKSRHGHLRVFRLLSFVQSSERIWNEHTCPSKNSRVYRQTLAWHIITNSATISSSATHNGTSSKQSGGDAPCTHKAHSPCSPCA